MLLELLDLLLVSGLRNQLVNVAEGALRRDLEARILFPNAVATHSEVGIGAELRASRLLRRIGHLGCGPHPALARLRRHGHAAGSAKDSPRTIGHRRESDIIGHLAHGAANERTGGVGVELMGELFIDGRRCT